MKILVNHKPVPSMGRSVLKYLGKGTPREDVRGRILSAEEATAKFMRQTKLSFLAVGVVVAIALIGYPIWASSSAGTPAAQQFMILVDFGAIVLTIVLLLFLYQWRQRRWSAQLPGRIAGLPPAGTLVWLGPEAVLIGAEPFPWSFLRIDQLELTVTGSGEDAVMRIDRVILDGAGPPVVLDSVLIENGRHMVETACRRLLPLASA